MKDFPVQDGTGKTIGRLTLNDAAVRFIEDNLPAIDVSFGWLAEGTSERKKLMAIAIVPRLTPMSSPADAVPQETRSEHLFVCPGSFNQECGQHVGGKHRFTDTWIIVLDNHPNCRRRYIFEEDAVVIQNDSV